MLGGVAGGGEAALGGGGPLEREPLVREARRWVGWGWSWGWLRVIGENAGAFLLTIWRWSRNYLGGRNFVGFEVGGEGF